MVERSSKDHSFYFGAPIAHARPDTMNRLRLLRRQLFDIRPGEHIRTWSMFFYLLFVLFAYYILKPVSRGLFLTKFDPDNLPSLYILIAAVGGIFAYFYSKLAAKTSLRAAVFVTMASSVASLVAIWKLIHFPWMVYVLNVWMSLFSIVLVSQGWLVASNIFDAREAKRVYPLLGMGMVLGAACGGEFTSRTARLLGTHNLLLATAAMVVLAYIAFRIATSRSANAVREARAGQKEVTEFSFAGMVSDIARSRHLQVIVGIMMAMYMVDTLVEYQFQVTASGTHSGDNLTAFFGKFYGLYVNLTEFVFQLFVTAAVVRHFGVGGTLQIAPATILIASGVVAASHSITTSAAVRLTEASTRYTLNRTGMELLYMPLPQELRNRIKAFIDICVDRLSRGIGGVLLLLLTTTRLDLGVRGIAIVVICLCIPWIYLSYLARREYIASIRKRFEARRLDLESARVVAQDVSTIRYLESVASGDNPRQAAYALSLLGDAPGYNPRRMLVQGVGSPHAEVRDKVYRLAASLRFNGLPLKEPASPAEVEYSIAIASDRKSAVREFLQHSDTTIADAAIGAIREDRDLAEQLITREWLHETSSSPDPPRRALAARAIGIRGDQGIEALHQLLEDPEVEVAAAAIRSAGLLKNREYLYALIRSLGQPQLRANAVEAVASFGPQITGTLSDVILDESLPLRVRRQAPRVLRRIPHQRSVDVLIASVGHPDLTVRAAVLRALNYLRENSPNLNFENHYVGEQIWQEARHYYELNAALEPFRQSGSGRPTAARLLARTIEGRLKATLERLFRLLGLRYPPKEIYSAYRAFDRREEEQATAALEFLDNTLERDIKRLLLPLLDAPEHLHDHGKVLFGVEARSAEDAIRELIHSHDPWLVACAMAAAAELDLRNLAPEIHRAAEDSAGEVLEVARSAEARLAA
jgi:ATP/ADP translocase